MDLSVPFFGNPNISRQGDKGRQNLKKEYEPSWLDTFLEGFFGGDAVNPAEIVTDQSADWQTCMRADIAQLVTCDAIVLLPGWETSKGATLEHSIANALGFKVYHWAGDLKVVR